LILIECVALGLGAKLTGATHVAILALLTTALVAVISVRGGLLKHPVIGPALYRVGVYGTLQASYFVLASVLPHVSQRTFDAQLRAFDLAVFGVEPAVAFDVLVSPATTEWFAFFYYSYFWLLALHVFPMLFFGKQQRLVSEMGLGLVAVFCVGQSLYMAVPAFGPYRAFPELFTQPLPSSGLFMSIVLAVVAKGGAQLDVFPSLHTAGPLYLALFCVRHRRLMPYRVTWPIVAFFVANIILSTMFLRWHYLVDVVAGALLAVAVFVLVPRVTRWDAERRSRLGLASSWPEFPWNRPGQAPG
jgi:membrane-associated phospholipid phosphatase